MEKQEECLFDKMQRECKCKNCRDYTEGKRRFSRWIIIAVGLAVMILYISLSSAMYAGETINITTDLTNPVYTVTGNSSNLEGMNISFENNTIIISTVINFKPDNFTLLFFDNITKEVIKEVRVGGGTRTKYVDRNITVVQPLFLDRNNTIEIEINNCTNQTIIIPEEYIEQKQNFIIRFFKWIWGIFT